jgi:hypothetical protein
VPTATSRRAYGATLRVGTGGISCRGARDIDALLATTTDQVEWPDVANGSVLHGKESIRAYWEGQFSEADPQVNPLEFLDVGDGGDVLVVVDQRVLDHSGQAMTPAAVVCHRSTFAGPLVRRMVAFGSVEQATAAD